MKLLLTLLMVSSIAFADIENAHGWDLACDNGTANSTGQRGLVHIPSTVPPSSSWYASYSQLPPHVTVVLVGSLGVHNNPPVVPYYGLCLQRPMYRVTAPQQSSLFGTGYWSIPNSPAFRGSTWYFQAWHTDYTAPMNFTGATRTKFL